MIHCSDPNPVHPVCPSRPLSMGYPAHWGLGVALLLDLVLLSSNQSKTLLRQAPYLLPLLMISILSQTIERVRPRNWTSLVHPTLFPSSPPFLSWMGFRDTRNVQSTSRAHIVFPKMPGLGTAFSISPCC